MGVAGAADLLELAVRRSARSHRRRPAAAFAILAMMLATPACTTTKTDPDGAAVNACRSQLPEDVDLDRAASTVRDDGPDAWVVNTWPGPGTEGAPAYVCSVVRDGDGLAVTEIRGTPGPTAAGPKRTAQVVEIPLRQVVQIEGPAKAPDAPTATFDQPVVTAGKAISATDDRLQSVALAFDPVAFLIGQCLTSATVTMPAGRTTGGAGELRAYASAALSLADGRLPPAPGRPTARLDNAPAGIETITPDGSRSYDVTELIGLWAVGGRLPAGRLIPDDSPVVLLLRAAVLDEGQFTATFDVHAHPPTLTVQTVKECARPLDANVL